MSAAPCGTEKRHRLGLLLLGVLLVMGISSPAPARDALRSFDVPRDFPGWAALRVDEASLAETAMGAPAGQFVQVPDFCEGVAFDAAMANGSAAARALHGMAHCLAGMGAWRGTMQEAPSMKLVSLDRPVQIGPGITTSTQIMCAPVIRQR